MRKFPFVICNVYAPKLFSVVSIVHVYFVLVVAALGMGLCVAFIALVRLPSLKVSTLLLIGLLVYDVFWVRLNDLVKYTCAFKVHMC